MEVNMKLTILKAAVVSLILSISSVANAGLMTDWSISGDGITSSTEVSTGVWNLTYNNDGVLTAGNWEMSAFALEAGDFTIDWDLSGLHSWFEAEVSISAFSDSGSTVIANSFTSGTYTFSDLQVDEKFGFTVYGNHWDSSRLMRGTLEVSQVPEPTTLAIFGLGLLGFASRKFIK
jgi:hypothetical protein